MTIKHIFLDRNAFEGLCPSGAEPSYCAEALADALEQEGYEVSVGSFDGLFLDSYSLAETVAIEPEEIVVIDGDLANVLGAVAAGMRGVLLQDIDRTEAALKACGIDIDLWWIPGAASERQAKRCEGARQQLPPEEKAVTPHWGRRDRRTVTDCRGVPTRIAIERDPSKNGPVSAIQSASPFLISHHFRGRWNHYYVGDKRQYPDLALGQAYTAVMRNHGPGELEIEITPSEDEQSFWFTSLRSLR